MQAAHRQVQMNDRHGYSIACICAAFFAVVMLVAALVSFPGRQDSSRISEHLELVQLDSGPQGIGHNDATGEIEHAKESESRNLISISSCATSNCHGTPGGKEPKAWHDSWSVWASRDPHADAYRTLENDQSEKILEKLHKGETQNSGVPMDENAKWELIQSRCIDCHSTVTQPGTGLDFRTGVNCQSCHGGAADWVREHAEKDWQDHTSEEKAFLGFVELNTIESRVNTCVRCHVGLGEQDMNHDLIGAGHPRLIFDFNSHMRRLPKHWEEADPRNVDPVKMWETGQTAVTRASINLLKSRVHRASTNSPHSVWPEFAEYNCLNCHHHLNSDLFESDSARLGALTWSSFYAPRHGWTPNEPGTTQAVNSVSTETTTPLELLRAEMIRRQPGSERVIELSEQVLESLNQPRSLRETLKHNPDQDWESVANWYFAALARYESIARQRQSNETVGENSFDTNTDLRNDLLKLKRYLALPFIDTESSDSETEPTTAKELQLLIDKIQDSLAMEESK